MRYLSCLIILMIASAAIFAQSPHGNKLKIDCASCHEPSNWKIIPKKIKFNHNTETSFKLLGQHSSVSCQSCHQSLIFSDVKTQCLSCHQDVHKNSLGPDCAKCHTPTTWLVTDIIKIHKNGRFPLIGVHQNVDCASCHKDYAKLYFPPQNTTCISCHAKDYYATTAPNHVQSNISTNCQDCHSMTTFSWVAANLQNFNHSFFPLTAGHNIQNCFSCHIQGRSDFKGISTNCYSCHKQNYMLAKNPDHIKANFPTNCNDCHSTVSFTSSTTFDHNKTGFPLTGAHASVSCAQCHTTGYTNTPTDCYSCHTNTYNTAVSPVNHRSAGLPHTCQDCHNTTTFTATTFNHTTVGFTLTGAHTTVSCESCHKGTVVGTPTDCYSCHATDFAGTTNPNHAASGFPHTCTQCHSTTSWSGATFDHSTTGFALTGAHAAVQCAQCHTTGYTNTPTACYACHQSNYQTATTPVNHVAAGLPQTCGDCHNTTTFTATTFNHSTTGFALTGAHTTVSCESCHKGTVTGTPTDCYSCHSADFAKTTDPNHLTQNFSHDCSQCHSTTSWSGATFDHSTTGFALTGAHAAVQCAQCHTTGYTNTPTACYACHQSNYQTATTPVNHVAAGLPQTCGDCHNTTTFTATTFNHSATGFALTGAHTTVSCENCHKGTVTGTPTDCYSCHATDFAGTTNPNHAASGFPHTCTQCHSTTSWSGATFDHSTTGFALTGAHTSVQCASCHTSGYTTPPPTACYGCHTADYNSTTNPPHLAAGYPTDCTQCHTTTNFTTSTFNHTPFFPLTSNHNVACATCHITISNFAIFSCTATCHSQASTDRDHSGVRNYVYSPTSCYGCHPTGRGG